MQAQGEQTCKLPTERPQPGFKPGIFFCDSANHTTTVLPIKPTGYTLSPNVKIKTKYDDNSKKHKNLSLQH